MKTRTDVKNGHKINIWKNPAFQAVIIIIAAVAIFSAQTYAYFVDSVTTFNNQISAGTLNVEIAEGQSTDSGHLAFVNPQSVVPGTTLQKEIVIKNTGSLPIYARVKIEKHILNLEDQMPDGWEQLISFNIIEDDPSTPDINEGYWTYRDGYYYYIGSIKAGLSSPVLFDTVTFSEQLGNEFANRQIQINVICEAVQSNGNAETPLTAWGWPAEDSGAPKETAAPEADNTSASEGKEGM